MIILLVAIYSIYECIYKYPSNPPTMTVEYNGEKYKADVNELTWAQTKIPGQYIGSSTISTGENDIAKEMDSINVNPNETLNLKLSFDKYITKIEAIEVHRDDWERRIVTPLEFVDYTLKTPEEKGEHIYSVKVFWDSSPQSCHFSSYVIKLNVV